MFSGSCSNNLATRMDTWTVWFISATQEKEKWKWVMVHQLEVSVRNRQIIASSSNATWHDSVFCSLLVQSHIPRCQIYLNFSLALFLSLPSILPSDLLTVRRWTFLSIWQPNHWFAVATRYNVYGNKPNSNTLLLVANLWESQTQAAARLESHNVGQGQHMRPSRHITHNRSLWLLTTKFSRTNRLDRGARREALNSKNLQ